MIEQNERDESASSDVLNAEIVAPTGRTLVLPPTAIMQPGKAKTVYVALEDCSAEVVGVRVPPGAKVLSVRVGPNEFRAQESASVDSQLANMRPRCPRMAFLYVNVQNDTPEAQMFQPELTLENIDRNAAVAVKGQAAPSAKSGSTVTQSKSGRVTTVVAKGVTVTSIQGGRRQVTAPVYAPRKGPAKYGPNAGGAKAADTAARTAPQKNLGIGAAPVTGWNRRAFELVLLHVERGHIVPTQMIPFVKAHWAPFEKALGKERANEVMGAIMKRARILPTEKAKEVAEELRQAGLGSRILRDDVAAMAVPAAEADIEPKSQEAST